MEILTALYRRGKAPKSGATALTSNSPINLPLADLKFILFHRETQAEIQMPVLSICEEYSTVSFSAVDGDKFDGISGLPTINPDDSADEYDVYVEINGVRYLYDGIFYSDYKEVRRHRA